MRAVAGVGRYAVCVSTCCVAAFIVGNVSVQTPQPYESLLLAARADFGLAAPRLALLAAFAFTGFFAAGSVLSFMTSSFVAGFPGLRFGSCFGFSVPAIDQKRQPCRT